MLVDTNNTSPPPYHPSSSVFVGVSVASDVRSYTCKLDPAIAWQRQIRGNSVILGARVSGRTHDFAITIELKIPLSQIKYRYLDSVAKRKSKPKLA